MTEKSDRRRERVETILGLVIFSAALAATAVRRPRGGVLWMQERRRSRDYREPPE